MMISSNLVWFGLKGTISDDESELFSDKIFKSDEVFQDFSFSCDIWKFAKTSGGRKLQVYGAL
jgi:hypothetical protein